MSFNALNQPYPKSRYSVAAKNGMVCSSSALASQAGIDILKKGGNAVDAAIATAAVLTVVEPVSNGLGGDAFAIVWMNEKLYGINGSGYAPKNISIEEIKKLGFKEMPQHGWIPITIPGQPKTWAALSKRFGNLPLIEVLKPAIDYAENGYPVSAVVSYLWQKYVNKNMEEYINDPIFDEWFKVFTKNKEPYNFGDIVKMPYHAKSLKLIGETYAEAFYKGEIAKQIVKQSNEEGGFITEEDLSEYDVQWVDPISINYRGYDIWEIPPNGQGIVALMALNILKNFNFKKKDDVNTYHKQFEAMKMAFKDAFATVSDPYFMHDDYRKYLSEEYGYNKAKMISDEAISYQDINLPKSGTVYLCTADSEGNMVSYIQSNYRDFGSGVVIKDYGIAMQNRGCDFSLNENSVNCLMPRKRCYHTIIPGFITKEDKAIGPFGVMGGYMQPQGHVQVIMNLLDFYLNPQAALDAPRWQWKEDGSFEIEPEFNKGIYEKLRSMGHKIKVADNCYSFGRAEMILKLDKNVYVGATESRTDGSVACY